MGKLWVIFINSGTATPDRWNQDFEDKRPIPISVISESCEVVPWHKIVPSFHLEKYKNNAIHLLCSEWVVGKEEHLSHLSHLAQYHTWSENKHQDSLYSENQKQWTTIQILKIMSRLMAPSPKCSFHGEHACSYPCLLDFMAHGVISYPCLLFHHITRTQKNPSHTMSIKGIIGLMNGGMKNRI